MSKLKRCEDRLVEWFEEANRLEAELTRLREENEADHERYEALRQELVGEIIGLREEHESLLARIKEA